MSQRSKESARLRMRVAREVSATTSNVVNVVQGSFHQAGEQLSPENWGSQCTCMALQALLTLHVKSPALWTTADMNTILREGDQLYSMYRGDRQFMFINELPTTVEYSDHTYTMNYNGAVFGTLGTSITDDLSYTLRDAIVSAQRVSPFNFFVTGNNNDSYATLIMNVQDPPCYFIFDSHSRDKSGLLAVDGTSVLVNLHNIDSMTVYLRALCKSLNLKAYHQFEVIPCNVTRSLTNRNAAPQFYTPLADYLQQQQDVQSTPHQKLLKQQRQQRWLNKPGTCTVVAKLIFQQNNSFPSLTELKIYNMTCQNCQNCHSFL